MFLAVIYIVLNMFGTFLFKFCFIKFGTKMYQKMFKHVKKTTKNLHTSLNHPLSLYKTTFLLKMLEVLRLQYFEDFEYQVVKKITKKF